MKIKFYQTMRRLALKTMIFCPEMSANAYCWAERKATKAVEIKL